MQQENNIHVCSTQQYICYIRCSVLQSCGISKRTRVCGWLLTKCVEDKTQVQHVHLSGQAHDDERWADHSQALEIYQVAFVMIKHYVMWYYA